MESFASIDFETANHYRTSVCSVEIVIVENGIISDRFFSLIKPNPNFYCSWATEIQGINNWDTIESDLFPKVWNGIEKRITGLPLVAHNSTFDKGCLKAVHELYDMPYPDYDFFCTCCSARKSIPKFKNHQLYTVPSHIGFELNDHHNALQMQKLVQE